MESFKTKVEAILASRKNNDNKAKGIWKALDDAKGEGDNSEFFVMMKYVERLHANWGFEDPIDIIGMAETAVDEAEAARQG